jgi:hypothetical protein
MSPRFKILLAERQLALRRKPFSRLLELAPQGELKPGFNHDGHGVTVFFSRCGEKKMPYHKWDDFSGSMGINGVIMNHKWDYITDL